MEYPYGGRHQTHHRRDDPQEEYPPPPPPPHMGPPQPPHIGPPQMDPYHHHHHHQPPHPRPDPYSYYNNSEPPTAIHLHHSSSTDPYPNYPPQIPNNNSYNYYPPPQQHHHSQQQQPPNAYYQQPGAVQHVSHQSGGGPYPHDDYGGPHLPSSEAFVVNNSNNDDDGKLPGVLVGKPTVRLYCKAETNYSLTIRDGKVILAPSNPSDPFQHWVKDERFSTKVKDEEGFPSFALVNKATGQAMKHSIGATHPVQLTHYNPDKLDESVLWTLSRDLGDSYRTIRMINNIRLNVDAFNGDANHGGVRDGTTIVLWEWKKGENQRWKILPY